MKDLSEEQKQIWDDWLAERPKCVRDVAEKIVPWKKYRDIRSESDIGNRYSPVSYDEHEDGTVTVCCEKSNEELPFLGGYGVFGMNPNDLIEAD